MEDLRNALKLSLPVLGAYWFLGITYGLLASKMGYSIWLPVSMAMIVYSGSVEFIALTILLGAFHPLASVAMALMVSARHLFYGISMLERYRGAGWRKPFLIYLLTDETFALNYANKGRSGNNYDGCDCEEVLKLIAEDKINTTPLITHRFPLSKIEEAYRIFENKEDGVIKNSNL